MITRERSITGLAVLVLLFGCEHGGTIPQPVSASAPESHATGARYFFVVPKWLPDGSSSKAERKVLERWLVQWAGGFTRIGPVRGGWHDGKDLIEQDSIAYFIVGPGGMRSEIEERVSAAFRQQRTLVVTW